MFIERVDSVKKRTGGLPQAMDANVRDGELFLGRGDPALGRPPQKGYTTTYSDTR